MEKYIKKKSLELLAKIVFSTAEKEANSACFLFGYQPKVPTKLKAQKAEK